jgi:hypothetical protein
MNLNLERPSRNSGKRVVRILFLATVALGLFLLLTVTVVPPITGRVADAISGKSVRGVHVRLQTSHYQQWSVITEDRGMSSTNVFGWFFLPGALHWVGLPLQPFRSYWLTVNEGDAKGGQEEISAATQVLYNPMSNRRGSPAGNGKYFPLVVTFRKKGCDRVWAAACMYKRVWWGFSVPLIPVLNDVGDCKKIEDTTLRENCRQLNTYRAAFLHVDSYDQVQKGKALCAEVDHGDLSATCLQQLHLYIANPQAYGRPTVPPTIVPLPGETFVDGIGRALRFQQGCSAQESFTGQFHCGASYGPRNLVWWANVGFYEWPDENTARKALPVEKPQYTDYKEATLTDVKRPDGKIRLYQGPQHTAAFWVSKNKMIEVFFYEPIPEREQFIAHYLREFPSSLQ